MSPILCIALNHKIKPTQYTEMWTSKKELLWDWIELEKLRVVFVL